MYQTINPRARSAAGTRSKLFWIRLLSLAPHTFEPARVCGCSESEVAPARQQPPRANRILPGGAKVLGSIPEALKKDFSHT
eukprot:3404197-Prymnesium_polylepis.1